MPSHPPEPCIRTGTGVHFREGMGSLGEPLDIKHRPQQLSPHRAAWGHRVPGTSHVNGNQVHSGGAWGGIGAHHHPLPHISPPELPSDRFISQFTLDIEFY